MNLSQEKLDLLLKNYLPIICGNIRKFRKESGMSVIELSEIVDLTPEYLKRIESITEKRKNCSLKLLIKFSIIFDKSLDEFLKE